MTECVSLTRSLPDSRIRAGRLEEVCRESAEWVFVDLGFARDKSRTCGLLEGDKDPCALTFSELVVRIKRIVESSENPLNLLIEAPLSVAFSQEGNPTGRSIEKRGKQTRYWYCGPGPAILVAATYLLRHTYVAQSNREIRLFEGFVSYKPREKKSSHTDDVRRLQNIVWKGNSDFGRIVGAEDLKTNPRDTLVSAFAVAGMDFGISPIIELIIHED